MNNKTIGSFIAALRKVNGLTQKELAEKLNVSDKAVSRWERDESLPDLMLIPVIADIFGITSDELLRGERKKSEEAPTVTDEKKTKTMIEHLLKSKFHKFENLSIISLFLIVAGLALFLILYLHGYPVTGFIISGVFAFVSSICVILFARNYYYETDSEEIESELKESNRTRVFRKAFITVCFAMVSFIGLIGFMFYFDFSFSVYIFLAIVIVLTPVCDIIYGIYSKKKNIVISEKSVSNRKLRKKISISFFITVVLTIIVMLIINTVNLIPLVGGTSFTTKEDFIEFMKTYEPEFDENEYDPTMTAVITFAGEEVEFPLNDGVHRIDPGKDKITVYTDRDSIKAGTLVDNINIGFIFVYIAEIITVLIVYLRKRVK